MLHIAARIVAGGAALLITTLGCTLASAQSYPTRQVRIVVPFAPGGGTDITARLVAQKLTAKWGQPVVVDNRPGAGGTVGAEIVARAPADGYTLLMTSASLSVAVTLYPKLSFNPVKDFIPVTQLVSVPLVLTVHPSVPARNVQELVALSKQRRGGINFGSNGSGTTSHLAGGLLNSMAGIELTHIPYKGAGASITALLSGEVDMGFLAVLAAQPFLKSGRLRPLAVTTRTPSTLLPGVPTLDSAFAGFDIDNWYGLFVLAGTPSALIPRLHADMVEALMQPDVTGHIRKEGAEPVGNTPAQFAAFFAREVEKYARIIAATGSKAE